MMVETALSGTLGFERALALPPAAICLDTDLHGELDGWQVMVRLKANQATRHIPVVCWGMRTGAALRPRSVRPSSSPSRWRRRRSARRSSGSSRRAALVLVVGDNQGLRRIVVETLARDGGELREAADEVEALAMIAARPPDALVLDLIGSGLLGFGAIERLLARPETRGLPVVVLTSRELSAGEHHFLEARSVMCVAKREYPPHQLRRLVRHAQPRLRRGSCPRRRRITARSRRKRGAMPSDQAYAQLDAAGGQAHLARISCALMRVYAEQFGREPARAHSHYVGGDALACVLRGTLTRNERRLTTQDEHQRLHAMRLRCQYGAEDAFRAAVEQITGRRVIAIMSGIDTRSDIASEIFLFEPF